MLTTICATSKLWLKTHAGLIFLLGYAFAVRFLYPATGSFAFLFDHGKDSLNVLELLALGQFKLVGPWTSIPGLYFGPAWYYFLGACFALGNLSPAAPVWGMIVLALIQVYLAYRYFGLLAGVSVAAGASWLITSTSAWNPYPLLLVSWLILVLLQRLSQAKTWSYPAIFATCFLAGLGFHFSSAYAIFYLPILGAFFLSRWRSWTPGNRKKTARPELILAQIILVAGLGFALPFAPQFLYELRHDFVQTKAIGAYFGAGGEAEDALSWAKVSSVSQKFWGELKLGIMPLPALPQEQWQLGLQLLSGLILIGATIYFLRELFKRQFCPPPIFWWAWLFILIPLGGFYFLHFNLWYVLGALPAAVIIVSTIISRQPRLVQFIWVILFLFSGLSFNLRDFSWTDTQQNSVFYRQRQELWQTLKAHAGDQAFKVYVYEPDIYDFAWQYLILRDGLIADYPLPVEFSYHPNPIPYTPAKLELLERLSLQPDQSAYTYYLLDQPDPDYKYFQEWQGQNPDFAQASLLGSFGPDLFLYVASTSASATASSQMI